jgi:hypothetical protein
MDYHELEKTTVGKLREMAKEHPDLKGVTAMPKRELVDLLADKLGIEKPHKVVVGLDKFAIKQEIRALKKLRDEALGQHDRAKVHHVRRKIHQLRHKLRRAVRVAS